MKKLNKNELYHEIMKYVSDEVAMGHFSNRRINPRIFNHILDKTFDHYYKNNFSVEVVAKSFVRKLKGYSE